MATGAARCDRSARRSMIALPAGCPLAAGLASRSVLRPEMNHSRRTWSKAMASKQARKAAHPQKSCSF
eukprot:6203781-Pleurochrysis_carterae.AAC.5